MGGSQRNAISLSGCPCSGGLVKSFLATHTGGTQTFYVSVRTQAVGSEFGEVLISQSLSRSCVIPGPRQWASPGPRERGHWLLCQGSRGTEALCAGSSRRGPSFSGVTFLHVLRERWQGSSSSGFKKMKPTGFIRRGPAAGAGGNDFVVFCSSH